MQWLDQCRRDVAFALRQFRRAPAFTLTAALTLALGIGANSAMFALVDAALLRPLPFPEADRLVMLSERSETSPRGRVSPLNLVDWRERSRTLDVVGAFIPNVGGMVMTGADGTAETVSRQWVTAEYFAALGVRPVAGRPFLREDDTQRLRAVVLSEPFWRARFNGDPSVIGEDLRLDGESWTVVGVVPDEAELMRTSLWALIRIEGAPPAVRGQYPLRVIGRLKPGVTLEAASADLTAIAADLAREYPATNAGRGANVEPLRDAVIGGELRQTSLLFLGVVGFVLLICCANVANLLLTRATVRRRELAIRSALGASRARVMRQLLTEGLALAVIGGILGVAVGAAILDVAPRVIPRELLPASLTLSFDARVLAFCAATALLVGMLFGLAPAWQATEFDAASAIASQGRTATGRGGRTRGLLVVGQVATAVVLLFGAGLLLRTLLAVENVDRGYRAHSVLTMILDPMSSTYPTDEAELRFYQAVEDEVRAVPGVAGVTWATTLPLGRSYQGEYFFEVEGGPPLEDRERPEADYQIVSPSYFPTLDLPVVAGRAFDERDAAAGVPVCIVNEALARRYFAGRSPLGARLAVRETAKSTLAVREIVGVARQVKSRPDETEDLLQIYVPLAQDTPGDIFMLVRPTGERVAGLAASVRGAIGRVDREGLVSVRSVMTLEDVVWEATGRHRFRAVLVMAFAGLALVMAMVGLFGTLSYAVQQRVRDFGVRRALGATTGDVVRLVTGDAVRVIAGGVAIGLALATVLGQLLAAMLFGVRPLDPLTFASVTVVLALTAVAAAAGPAWRAARIDPAVALRSE